MSLWNFLFIRGREDKEDSTDWRRRGRLERQRERMYWHNLSMEWGNGNVNSGNVEKQNPLSPHTMTHILSYSLPTPDKLQTVLPITVCHLPYPYVSIPPYRVLNRRRTGIYNNII